VNWSDGVAFVVAPMPPTEDIVKESLGGRLHYASVMLPGFRSRTKSR